MPIITSPADGITRLDYDATQKFLSWDESIHSETMTADEYLDNPALVSRMFKLSADGKAVLQRTPAVYIPEGGLARYPGTDRVYAFVEGYKPFSVKYLDVLRVLKTLAAR